MREGSLMDILGWGQRFTPKLLPHLVTFVCSSNFPVDCERQERWHISHVKCRKSLRHTQSLVLLNGLVTLTCDPYAPSLWRHAYCHTACTYPSIITGSL